MSHLSTRTSRSRFRTPEEWLPVAAQVSRLACYVSTRMDVMANVGPGIGGPFGTACWAPRSADLDVNTERCLPGRDPLDVNLDSEAFRLSALPFVGAIVHEAAHARWSRWVPYDLLNAGFSRAECDVTIALEESRIERWAARALPIYKPALAQVALDVVLRDFRVSETPYGASISAALTLARHDAGLLTSEEAERFAAPLRDVLGTDALSALRTLWINYQNMDQGEYDDHSAIPFKDMQAIAAAWLDVIRSIPPKAESGERGESDERGERGESDERGERGESGESDESDERERGESDESDESESDERERGESDESDESESDERGKSGEVTSSGDASDTGSGSGIPGEDNDAAPAYQPRNEDDEPVAETGADELSPTERAIRALAGDMSVNRECEALDAAKKQRAKENVEARTAEVARRRRVNRDAKALMAKAEPRTRDHSPTTDDHIAATSVRQHLERITYRDMAVAKRDHVQPGGRLRAARAVQQAAVVARGGRDRVPMWRSKERHRCDETPVTIGIMVDVSGSMSGNMAGAASITYALSRAVTELDGRVSSVEFGNSARYIAKSTTPLTQIPVLSAVDGWENFSAGLALLDYDLRLLDQRGARILVIFSDGVFVRDEAERAVQHFMTICRQERIVVIWANTDEVIHTHGYGIVLEELPRDPKAMLQTVGQTILAAVERIDRTTR